MVEFIRRSDGGDPPVNVPDGGPAEGDGGESDDGDVLVYCLVFGLIIGTLLMIFIESIGGMGPAIGIFIGLAAWIFLGPLS